MPQINYQGQSYAIDAPETILEGLERAGLDIPFSCRSGLCHSCIMQAESQPPPTAQQGLSDNQKLQHFFLACSCIPKDDMVVSLMGDTTKHMGRVSKKMMLNDSVLGLFIEAECRWFPGQYLSVWYDDFQGRSYSIASRCDENKLIELHVKRHDQGLVSRWLHDDIEVGQQLTLSQAMGNCFYSDNHQGHPILMAATGTGLAPLYGVLQEALAQGHNQPLYLYLAAGEPTGLYYLDELKALAADHDNVNVIPVVRRNLPANEQWMVESDLVDLIKQQHRDLSAWKVFLCGSPDMINQLQRYCFFQGAKVDDILVDAFVIEDPTTK